MIFRKLFTPLIALLFAVGTLSAQEVSLNLAPDFDILIDGDSNVRDWDANVTEVNAEFILNGYNFENLTDLRPEHFQRMILRMPVEEIETDSRRLTRNLQDYLKGDDYPIITFELTQVNEVRMENGTALIIADGVITAAGQSHNVTMNVTAENSADGSILFSGAQELLMTDFGIDPPTAMLGSIRARDEMTIYYKVRFTR